MQENINIIRHDEIKYTYSQSSQLNMQTCCIGMLRGDFGNDEGPSFSWTDCIGSSKTEEFKFTLDSVINSLRSKGNMLYNLKSLSKFCYENQDSRIGENEFGFRIEQGQYTFMIRLNPRRGEYNFYCYAYESKWLYGHMYHASRGIRFIDPDSNEKFRIDDGGKIMIHRNGLESESRTCRYIDDYHLEVGNNLYHICEFAEIMARNGCTCEPILDTLPEKCYSTLPDTGEIIIIKRNVQGYYSPDIPFEDKASARELVDEYNEQLGISKAQEAAMRTGSMFGFAVPGADPKNYDEDGKPIKPKEKDYCR